MDMLPFDSWLRMWRQPWKESYKNVNVMNVMNDEDYLSPPDDGGDELREALRHGNFF